MPSTEAGKRLLAAIRSGVAGLFASDEPGNPSPIPASIAAIEAEAVERERERIVEAVMGLPTDEFYDAFGPLRAEPVISRAAVLAIVRGETP